MPNVTQSNFIEESNELIRLLPSAAFVAIDEEMTGIFIPKTPRPRKDQTPSERYNVLKAVPEKYSIIQLGICLFHEHPNFRSGRAGAPEFIARKFNFYLFPPADNRITREVVLNPSSIAFLNQHNMNFDTWTKQGVSFVTSEMAEELLSKFQRKELEKQEKKAANDGYNKKPGGRKVELRRTEDIDFHARAMASLREWLDSANQSHARGHNGDDAPEGVSFLLPPANSFLRRALYETLATEYPSLIVEKAGAANLNQIRVLRLNPEEQRAREERLRRESWEELIVNQIGVWRVFMALSLASHGLEIPTDSITFAQRVGDINWDRSSTCMGSLTPMGRNIPIIVHNGYMDLMFLLSHFHSHTLPPTFSEAKALVHSYFPTVYDTKFLSTECTPASLWNESTHLEGLFGKIIRENEDISRRVELVPDVIGSSGFAYLLANEGQAHDAAYDAFMTGAVYLGICHIIGLNERLRYGTDMTEADDEGVGTLKHLLCGEDDEQVKASFGRNQLYLMQSVYSVDLENAKGDQLSRGMIPEAIFRISNFDPSVTTRTIVQSLSDLLDSRSERVNFEIIWVDDATFLVAASRKPPARAFAERPAQQDSSSVELEVIREHGELILRALRNRFPRENIVSWKEYVASLGVESLEEESSWTSRVGQLLRNLFGWSSQVGASGAKREFGAGGDSQPGRKRRRII